MIFYYILIYSSEFFYALGLSGSTATQSIKGKSVQLPLLVIIIAIGIVLSLVSYAYFLSISSKIDETVTSDLKRQARIEAFQITEILEDEIQVVSTSVMNAAKRNAILNGELEGGADIVNAAQQSTPEITDRYFWLDQNGKVIWSSAFDGNPQEYDQYKGFDVSDRPYFVNPATNKQPYLSPVILSPDNSQRMFIAFPILDNGIFEGVIAASIKADIFGQLVQSKLSPEIESSIGIIDPNGVIIYTDNSEFIGENLFGEKIQSVIRPAFASQEQLTEFNDFLKASIEGGSDSKDFSTIAGQTSTVTYLSIKIRTNNESLDNNQGHHFLTLYLTAPHNVANIIGPLVEQQRNFSIAVVVTIAAVTAIISYIIITWNKRLERTVIERTDSLNEANEQLKVHNKLQTEFINIAAHELRTPVQPILGIAEQLQAELGDRDNEIKISRSEIEMLSRNARRLAQLTRDVLEVTRIESNSLSLVKQKVDLNVKIQNVIEDSRSFIEDGQNLTIIFEPLPNSQSVIVEADKVRLSQVLSNLIRNAIKFTKDGLITIQLEQREGDVEVSVKDTGGGIDAEMFPRLFTKFTTNSERGTGLGLYISKKIVEAHGGRIWAENNPDGKGATFRFTLPMVKSVKQEAQQS
jgi:signal transduction histidine kinase